MSQKKQGLKVTHAPKSEKVNEYIYVLKDGSELTFKSKEFPTKRPLQESNGQLLMF